MTKTTVRLVDPDIIDYAYIDNPLGMIDVEGRGSTSALIVPIHIPTIQNKKGPRTHTALERQLRDVLCVNAIMSLYGLEALGYSPTKARDTVQKKLSTITLEKAIRLGRKACPNVIAVKNADELNHLVLTKYQRMNHLKNRDSFKEEAAQNEIRDLSLLDQAYRRSKELIGGIYNAQRAKSRKTTDVKIITAVTYRNESEAKSRPELLLISIRTRINSALLWQSNWNYRHILESAANLAALHVGFPAKFSASSLYTLFRMCEEDNGSLQDGHYACKATLKSNVELLIGKDAFMAAADKLLHELGLLPHRPKAVEELEKRCRPFPLHDIEVFGRYAR